MRSVEAILSKISQVRQAPGERSEAQDLVRDTFRQALVQIDAELPNFGYKVGNISQIFSDNLQI